MLLFFTSIRFTKIFFQILVQANLKEDRAEILSSYKGHSTHLQKNFTSQIYWLSLFITKNVTNEIFWYI